jgi:hypothetical protein
MTSNAGSFALEQQREMDFQEMVEEVAQRAKVAEKGKGGTQSAGVVEKTKKPAKAPGLDKKWKDVSWKGAAYAFFQPLPAEGKNMLKKAYLFHVIRSPNSNQPAHTYNVTDLADPAFSRGSLFPVLSSYNAWPSFLTQLYTSVHECVRYAACLVGSKGAQAKQILDRMHRCNKDFEEFVKKHESELSPSLHKELSTYLTNYQNTYGVEWSMAYPAFQFSESCAYYDGKEIHTQARHDYQY